MTNSNSTSEIHTGMSVQTVDEIEREIASLKARTTAGLNAHPTQPLSRADAHERYVNAVMGVVSTDVVSKIDRLSDQLQKLKGILIEDAERVAYEVAKHVRLGENVRASADAIARNIAALADEQAA